MRERGEQYHRQAERHGMSAPGKTHSVSPRAMTTARATTATTTNAMVRRPARGASFPAPPRKDRQPHSWSFRSPSRPARASPRRHDAGRHPPISGRRESAGAGARLLPARWAVNRLPRQALPRAAGAAPRASRPSLPCGPSPSSASRSRSWAFSPNAESRSRRALEVRFACRSIVQSMSESNRRRAGRLLIRLASPPGGLGRIAGVSLQCSVRSGSHDRPDDARASRGDSMACRT